MFRNKYSISVDGVNTWTFRMPLFTIRFYGISSAGPEIWVRVGPSKMEWNILLKAGGQEQPLVAALAFIQHRVVELRLKFPQLLGNPHSFIN